MTSPTTSARSGGGRRGRSLLTLASVIALSGTLGACADAATTADQPSATAAEPVTSRSSAESATTTLTASTAEAGAYSTSLFVERLDLAIPSWLDSAPAEETGHLVTFFSPDNTLAVRVLLPVVVYPPASTATTPLPQDYLGYLLTLADHGGQFTDRQDTTVDGRPTTILTGRTNASIDGSMGCPEVGISADDCFGLQPEFVIRVAVITTDAGPLLIWLRTNADDHRDTAADARLLEGFLSGVHFADRRPGQATANSTTPLDGTYTWTIAKDDTLAHGLPPDQTPAGLTMYPASFTMSLEDGRYELQIARANSIIETVTGTFEATADHLTLRDVDGVASFDVVREPDGTLHLTMAPIGDLGAQFLLTTAPWTRTAP